MAGNFIRVRKNNPIRREQPAAQKIQPKTFNELWFRSAIFPATNTARSVQPPKIRFRRAKYRPPNRSGTNSEMDEDQATLAMLLAQVATSSMTEKTVSRAAPKAGNAGPNIHGNAPSEKV